MDGKTGSAPGAELPRCEICLEPALRRVSGNKYWCGACGHLQS
jgi:hypothetical protein